ncbi:MAG: hypothetical protein ACTSO5_04950 [Candidatus Heimdallarchaeaceae archaeon]
MINSRIGFQIKILLLIHRFTQKEGRKRKISFFLEKSFKAVKRLATVKYYSCELRSIGG